MNGLKIQKIKEIPFSEEENSRDSRLKWVGIRYLIKLPTKIATEEPTNERNFQDGIWNFSWILLSFGGFLCLIFEKSG